MIYWIVNDMSSLMVQVRALHSFVTLLFLIYFDTITQIPLSLGSFMDIYADYLLSYRNQRAYSTRYR